MNLKARILQRIEAEGALPLPDYMALCLTDAEAGYYTQHDPLGAAGDFTTAPEICQIFGELIGLWLVECWRMQGCPAPLHLIEYGPGRGTLMADALRAAHLASDFIQAIQIHLVEASPVLREKQAKALKDYNITWQTTADDLPKAPCLILANEFFDALPIAQYVYDATGWQERVICATQESLRFDLRPARLPAELGASLPAYPAVGDCLEYAPLALEIAGKMGAHLARYGGAALICDYGYTCRQYGDSFQAVAGHKPVSPLANPGQADLTAHVDFQRLAAAFEQGGALPLPLMTQGDFLRGLGLELRLQQLLTGCADASAQQNLASGARRLVDPAAMGALFKMLRITGQGWQVPL